MGPIAPRPVEFGSHGLQEVVVTSDLPPLAIVLTPDELDSRGNAVGVQWDRVLEGYVTKELLLLDELQEGTLRSLGPGRPGERRSGGEGKGDRQHNYKRLLHQFPPN
ncbi:hypothetical protein D3C72_1563320 [compost metagenome]